MVPRMEVPLNRGEFDETIRWRLEKLLGDNGNLQELVEGMPRAGMLLEDGSLDEAIRKSLKWRLANSLFEPKKLYGLLGVVPRAGTMLEDGSLDDAIRNALKHLIAWNFGDRVEKMADMVPRVGMLLEELRKLGICLKK